jgi:hypothetical protein
MHDETNNGSLGLCEDQIWMFLLIIDTNKIGCDSHFQPKFNDFGLNTLSHHDSVIHLETNSVEIQFATAQEMRVTANLIGVDDDHI